MKADKTDIFFDNAVLLIDKTEGMTSFDTEMTVRKLIGQKKIGHSGTLDSFATGLLMLCTGATTKLVRYFMERNKRYCAKIQLGIKTDTDDLTGNVLETRPFSGICEADIQKNVSSFVGEHMQLPPVYSALKIKGKRASDMARRGDEVVLEPRKVFIDMADVIGYDALSGRLSIEVSCSKGTYIRSLARDVGNILGTGAHCIALRRISSGRFSVNDAVTINELSGIINGAPTAKKFCLPALEALSDFGKVVLKSTAVKKAQNGAWFSEDEVKSLEDAGKEFIILSEDEKLIAIANIDIDKWQIKYQNVFSGQ
ncbi:MAG: tRNA pseudouridine(55) synthase TruB [Leptospirales bacterium]|nr:tRNA pseudouridine(55) synthase TruB [Leptospirales bacterium]